MPNKGVLSCYIGITECINREINVLSILEITESYKFRVSLQANMSKMELKPIRVCFLALSASLSSKIMTLMFSASWNLRNHGNSV